MGTNVFSLRKEVKVVEGKVIGRAAVTYNTTPPVEGVGNYNRLVGRTGAFAEKAREAIGHVDYMVYGAEFADGEPVYQVDDVPTVFNEDEKPGMKVGTLRKVGRGKWHVEFEGAAPAANDVEEVENAV